MEESIGVKLEMERELKGLSVADVSKDTKISSKYIIAMENETFDEIPGEAYVRAFLRSYSKYLGIDPEEIIQKYEYNRLIRSNEQLPETLEEKKKSKVAPISIGVIIVAVLVFLVWFLLDFYPLEEKTKNTKPLLSSAESTSEQKDISSDKSFRKPDGKIDFKDSFVYLVANAREKVWIKVSVDGKPVEPASGVILEKGDVKTWRAREKFEVDTGNAGGLEIEFDGRPVGVLGHDGEVIRNMSFTRSGIFIK